MNRNDSDLSLNTRSRLLGSSDHETLIREGIIPSPKVNELSSNPRLKQLKNYFSNNIFLDDEWHSEEYLHIGYEELKTADSSWRLREKMRTVGVALVICLNIGIDPPDLFKPNPCAKKECWFDPTGQKQKGLEYIGNALQSQYEKWQAKAKYKQCLDPTSEDLRRICMNLRKGSRSDRLLFHYNGHGVPKPTKNGELWVFGKHYTHYTPVAICELRSWLGDPAIYVLDCSAAGLLIQHLVDNMTLKDSDLNASYDSEHPNLPTTPSNHHLRENNSNYSFISQAASDSATIVLAACKGNEQLPFHPMYPVDIFTSCLTTPTTIAIRWFILQNPYSMHGVNPDLAESIPGKDNDRKTPRGELNWILTAITDTIAWNTLPASCFKKMFRKDLLVASLFRNFLLAKRIMKSFGCTPQSWPPMPDTTTHSLWQSWDMALESFLTHYVSLQRGSSMVDYRNNMPFTMPTNISFFNDQLSAFEMWLEFGTVTSSPPPQLPVVLQVLLSQSHRMRALQLLKKFLSLGNDAIRLSLILGIFPYILKLLQNPADDIKLTLISIWASVIGFDSSCRQELVREKSQLCFIQILGNKTISSSQRCLAAFVLSEVCNNYKEGQQSCLQLGLHRTCTTIISQPEVMNSSSLKLWVCLCLFKLCEDFLWAKYLCLTEAGHTALYPLLIDPDPVVRTAAVLALGELFGASALVKNANPSASTPGGSNYGGMSGGGGGGLSTPGSRPQMRKTLSSTSDDFASNMIVEEKVLEESELQLALQILECCTDGSVMVRLEAVYALSKFFIQSSHIDCIKLVAKEIYLKNIEKSKHNSGTNTNTTTGNTISGSMSMNVNLSGGGGGSMSAAKMLERRSTSPGLENNFGKVGLIYPWHLNPLESTEITNKLESLIKLQLHLDNNSNQSLNADDVNAVPFVQLPPPAFTTPGSNNIKRDPLTESPDLMNTATGANNTTANTEGGGKSPTPDLATLMASAYVRLWLALTEVQGRDPHSLVAQAAATIRFRVHALISIDERNQYQQDRTRANSASSYQMTNSSMYSEALLAAAASGSYSPSTSATMNYLTSLQGTSQNNGNSTLNILEKRLKKSVTAESLMGGGDTGDHIHINTGDDLVPPSSSFDMMNTAPPLSPLGVVATSNTSYSSPKSMKARNVKFTANKLPKSSPFLTQPENQLVMDNNNNNYHHSSSMNNLHAYNTNTNVGIAGGTASGVNSRRNSRANKYFFLEAFKDYSHLTEDDLLICFSSNHYEIVKKNYMDGHNANSTTNSMISSYDPYQDPLSYESNQRSYRLQRLQEMLTNERILYEIFKDVEDRPEMMLERKNKQLLNEEQQHNNGLLGGGSGNSGGGGGSGSNTNAKNNIGGTSSSSNTLALSSLPHNSCKFEQKSTLRMDSPMTTSLIMFHAFQDILVVASESTANIWSLQSHHRIIEVKNRHTLKTSSPNGYEIGAHTPNRSTRLPQVTNVSSNNNSSSSNQENSLFAPVASSRITSMIWINESYDPLLLLGSDDGVIKIWRDVASTDTIQHHHQTYSSSNINNNNSNHSGSNINNESSGGGSPALGGNNNSHSNAANSIELATAFSALPDIAETSRGSGIVVSWQQTAGTLVVGGNSNTIRVWDVGREQNVRVFYTGVETCLTAMATNTVANGFTPTTNSLSDLSNYGDSSGYNSASQPVTWTFAGFADGSIAVYDERVHSNGGRVHFSHTHGTWVNYAHLRADVPEVVIGSVRGTVKFWDLRALRTYKTLEVQKSPLTSLTVHNLSPILAAGSHAQFIKILTLSGEQLGNVIKYYDGFLGQRIGPVSCLAFHPHKLLLGASSTDGIVSIYHAATDK